MEDLAEDITAAKAAELAARARDADREKHAKGLENFLLYVFRLIDENARCGSSRCRIFISRDFSAAHVYEIVEYRHLLEMALRDRGFGYSTKQDYIDIWWEVPLEENVD
jgi:hypothetical protein